MKECTLWFLKSIFFFLYHVNLTFLPSKLLDSSMWPGIILNLVPTELLVLDFWQAGIIDMYLMLLSLREDFKKQRQSKTKQIIEHFQKLLLSLCLVCSLFHCPLKTQLILSPWVKWLSLKMGSNRSLLQVFYK